MMVLCTGQALIASALGLREGIDYVFFEQVPLGVGDLVWDAARERWSDRRTTDGEILRADGSNANGR